MLLEKQKRQHSKKNMFYLINIYFIQNALILSTEFIWIYVFRGEDLVKIQAQPFLPDFKFHLEYQHLKAGESQECLSRAGSHKQTQDKQFAKYQNKNTVNLPNNIQKLLKANLST